MIAAARLVAVAVVEPAAAVAGTEFAAAVAVY